MLRYYLIEFFTEFTAGSICPYNQIMLRNKGFSQSVVGIVLALSQLAAFSMPLINGFKIDATGQLKKRMFIHAILTALCFYFFTCCSDFYAAVFFVIAVGCYSCLIPACDTYLTRNLNNPSRYGTIRAVGTIGYITFLVIVPLLKFPMNTDNTQISLSIGFCIVILMTCICIAPKFDFKGDIEKKSDESLFKRNFFDCSWFDKSFYILMSVVMLEKMGMVVVEMLLGSYMTEVLHLGQKFTMFVALASFTEIFALLYCGKWVEKKKITIWTLLFASCATLVVRLLLYAYTKSVTMFAFAQCLHFFNFGCLHIAATLFISTRVDKKHTSVAMAIYWAFGCYFTQLVGSLIGGYIIDTLGYDTLFKMFTVFPLIAVFVCLVRKKILEG